MGLLMVGHIFLYFGSLFFVCLPLQFCFAIVSLVPFLYILRPYVNKFSKLNITVVWSQNHEVAEPPILHIFPVPGGQCF